MTVKYCIRRLCIGVQAWKAYQTEAFQVVLIAGAALDAEDILIFYFLFFILDIMDRLSYGSFRTIERLNQRYMAALAGQPGPDLVQVMSY